MSRRALSVEAVEAAMNAIHAFVLEREAVAAALAVHREYIGLVPSARRSAEAAEATLRYIENALATLRAAVADAAPFGVTP